MSKTVDKIGDVVVRLRFLPNWSGPATEAQRLRSALKMLLRGYGIQNRGIVPDVSGVLPPPAPGFDVEKDEPPFAATPTTEGGRP